MHINLIVNAGGAATRMGPWAPSPKQFLPIGPWDPVNDEGVGPSNSWRILHFFDRLEKEFTEITFSKSIAIPPSDPGCRHEAAQLANEFGCTILTDPAPNWGPLGFLHAGSFEGGILMHNADDLLPYEILREVVREAAGLTQSQDAPESVNVLAAALCTQYGAFGELGGYYTPEGALRYIVKEKPKLADSLVGCGVLYLTPTAVKVAQAHPEWRNSSIMLNELAAAKDGVELSVVAMDAECWQTFNTPKEYMDVCANPKWKDEAWQTWNAGK